MEATKPDLDLVGLADIAARLAAPPGTVYAWRKRGRLPRPDWLVSGDTPVWLWSTIASWAQEHGYIGAPDRWDGWGVDGTGVVRGSTVYGIAVARNLGTARVLLIFGQHPTDPRAPLTVTGERALIQLSRFTPLGLPPHAELAESYSEVIAASGVNGLVTIHDV